MSFDPRDEAGFVDCVASRASRDASLRVTLVVVVVVSVCGSSSLFHFLLRLACGPIVAEIEIVVCRLKAMDERVTGWVHRKWLVQQERTPSQHFNDDNQQGAGNPNHNV